MQTEYIRKFGRPLQQPRNLLEERGELIAEMRKIGMINKQLSTAHIGYMNYISNQLQFNQQTLQTIQELQIQQKREIDMLIQLILPSVDTADDIALNNPTNDLEGDIPARVLNDDNK